MAVNDIDGGLSRGFRRHDTVGTAVTVASILLLVAIASRMLVTAFNHHIGGSPTVDQSLVIALLLNVALILIGWRRQRALDREISGRTVAEARAQQLASRDPLTGLLNRRSLASDGAALSATANKRGKVVALVAADLDHFRAVNDAHGHLIGDALLRGVANAIVAEFPAQSLVARIGGDSFAGAFQFDARTPDTVEHIADRLVSRLAQPFDIDGVRCNVSASVGIARSDRDGSGIDGLLHSADIAMGAARKAGRNRHLWFDVAMERELQARADLEAALRLAIPRGEIVPYFEPQVDLASGRLVGFEVLARWEHPTRGFIEPDVFIPLAEQIGVIADLSLSVMHRAFAAARDWDASLAIAVNVSPWQLRDPWLAQKIIKLLAETGFPAARCEIEVTESALLDNLALARSIVTSLKDQGMSIALDDFGTGYSSLAHLRALPFDRVKIDRSFVTSIAENADSAAIVTAIARLGDSLNLPVTAEGVEDATVADRLAAIRVARGQGWHYGKPMSVAGVRRLLAERRMLHAPGCETGPISPNRRAVR